MHLALRTVALSTPCAAAPSLQLTERREAETLRCALSGYGAALSAGEAHDLPAAFRLVRLWLALAHEEVVAKSVGASLMAAPSHKALPLAYQMASRLSAGAPGRWVAGRGGRQRPT